jgi:protein-tyrosine phosphatase
MTPVSEILKGRLYQGGIDAPLHLQAIPDLHIATVDGSPPHPLSAKKVYYLPLIDDPTVNWSKKTSWVAEVLKAATIASESLRKGEVVLITCHAGLNRSGMITALALIDLGLSPKEAVSLVRRKRSRLALSNPQFVKVVYRSL